MKALSYYAQTLLFLYVAIVAGCSLMPSEVPETPRQAIAYGYVTVDSLADAVRVAKQGGHITDERRDQLASELQEALDQLVLSQNALLLFERTGDPEAGEEVQNRLSQAHALLSIIESMLTEVQNE